MEGGELTPALLSDRSAAPTITNVEVTLEGEGKRAAPVGVHVVALLEQRLGGGIVLLVRRNPLRSPPQPPGSAPFSLVGHTRHTSTCPYLYAHVVQFGE